MSAKTASKKKPASELHAEAVAKHYQARRDAGLPAHQVQEHSANPESISIRTVGGVCYVSFAGGDELEFDQTGLWELCKEFQAAFQAVS
jgi:hypothetical protein